jgi:DNA-directed RNA polymerase subunit N (RpoN/RPB10)
MNGICICHGCGKNITENLKNHKCDDKRLRQIAGSQKAHEETGIERTPSEYERIKEGFEMMSDEYGFERR